MLGRLQRTTRLDVGLATTFAGLAYLTWALVAGVSRHTVQEMILATASLAKPLPQITRLVQVFFVDAGVAIDVAGIAWLALSLCLIVYASRQKISISWPWIVAGLQTIVSALGAVVVAFAMQLPFGVDRASAPPSTQWQQVSGVSLWVLLAMAIVVWVTFVAWLLAERARLNRRGPSLRDGMKTQSGG